MSALSLPSRTFPFPAIRSWGNASVWLAAGVATGAGVGLAVALQQTMIAVAVMLVPALVALMLHPEWLPSVLVATAFAEALSTGSVTLSRLAGPLAVLVMIVALPGRRQLRLPQIGVLVAVGAYCMWALASAIWTVNPDSSLQQGGTGYALASLGLSAAFMLATAMFVERERDIRRLLVVFWLLSTATGLVSIVQYLSGYTRALGLSGDANFFAALQVVALPMAVVLANQVRRASTRLIVLVGLAVTVGSIVTSLSRGGILALAAVFVLLTLQPARTYFRTRARKRAFLFVAALGAGLLLVASYGALSARTSSLFTTADGGSGRTNLWRSALAGWQGHQASGIGFGAFLGQSNQLLLQTPGVDFSAYALRPTGQVVHNAYLESLVELGVVGLALFVAVLAAMASTLRASARRAAEAGATFLSSFSSALLVSLAGFALTSIFLSTETTRAFWILIGLSLAVPRVLLKEERLRPINGSGFSAAPSLPAARPPDTQPTRRPDA
jgi:O-antigen ligase